METLMLDGQALTLAEIESVALGGLAVGIAQGALKRIGVSRDRIESILAEGQTVYGVNTGFGKLADVRIPADKLAQLQTNLVRSHSAGVGQPLAEAEVRDESFGADNWLEHQKLTLKRATTILSIHNDESIPDGTLVQIPAEIEESSA